MKKLKAQEYEVVEEKPGLQLLSWVESDRKCYAIAVKREEHLEPKIVETFKPTYTVLGNALRSKAVKAFKDCEQQDYADFWPIVATCAKEVKVGHVLVLELEAGAGNLYVVTEVNPTVVFAVNESGVEVPWTRRRLDVQLERDLVLVTELEALPPRRRQPLGKALTETVETQASRAEDVERQKAQEESRRPMGLRGAGDFPGNP